MQSVNILFTSLLFVSEEEKDLQNVITSIGDVSKEVVSTSYELEEAIEIL